MAKKAPTASSSLKTGQKENKAAQVIQMFLENPTLKNTDIADKVGCTQQYSSNTLSRYKREHNLKKGPANTGMKTSTKEKSDKKGSRQGRKPATANAAKVTASSKKSTTGTSDTAVLLKARRDMECIVSRVGSCDAKTLLSDVTAT